jgi:DNA-directed RNA polymerase specialized sigma24 family protein
MPSAYAVAATLEPTRHGAAFDPDEFACPDPEPAALLEVRERAREAAGRLAALKPQERRTIGLQAAECSYAETQAITGWTYTKVSRCLTEGRAALSKLRPLPDVA